MPATKNPGLKQIEEKAKRRKKLTDEENIKILLDLDIGKPWRQIAKDHQVSTSTIAAVRNRSLQSPEFVERIKALRLPKLYEISEWLLDSFSPAELEAASLQQRGTLYGILQDKINQIEGKTGNINIAIATMTDLGLLKD